MNHDQVDAAVGRMERRTATQQAEAERLASVRSMGHVPKDCGPEIPAAPARGPVRMFMPITMYPEGEGDYVAKPAGHMGRKALQHADSFDVMRARSKNPNLFSPAQVAIGRFYRNITERHQSAGVRCSSMESLSRGSGGGVEFMDAVLRDRDQIRQLWVRIGDKPAMVVRRQRPSSIGKRRMITDRKLIDMVCIQELTITGVLREHDWPKKGTTVKALTQALCEALDRMSGSVRLVRTVAVHYGEGCDSPWAEKETP